MSAGTKVTIAVVVLFAALLGVYYGFGGPGSGVPPDELPPADVDRAQSGPIDDASPAGPAGDLDDQPSGVLTASVQDALGPRPTAAGPDVGVLASDGGLPASVARAKPPDDPWVIGPRPAFPAPAPEPGYTDYTVRDGDSMWTIADRWLGDPSRWGVVAEANPAINPERLRVGQRLRIPSEDPTAGPLLNAPARLGVEPSPPATDGQPAATFYTVRSGDSLTRIAESQYRDAGKWLAIYDANRAKIGGDPDRLRVGMRLRIPPT